LNLLSFLHGNISSTQREREIREQTTIVLYSNNKNKNNSFFYIFSETPTSNKNRNKKWWNIVVYHPHEKEIKITSTGIFI
jgi:hypothetical protein